MISEKGNVVIIFMNTINDIHAFTALKMEIILIMRIYYNKNQKLN